MANGLMSIIMLNWNRVHLSKLTVERILASTTVDHELIFVDNFSLEESGVRQYLRTVSGNKYTKNIILVENDKNYGVGGGRNTGIMRASGDYLFTVDDDVWLPEHWDKKITEACDVVTKLGITGVCVEPFNFPVKTVNGAKIRPKKSNLGGAALCLPRRVFKTVGFYMADTLYGHEDCEMYCRLDLLGLMSAYIEPYGKHLDKDNLKVYRAKKNEAHVRGSKQLGAMAQFRRRLQEQLKNTGSLYVPFDPKNFNPVDKDVFDNDLIKKG